MRRVILESPYAPSERFTTEQHVEYARACLKDCLERGEAPLASHLLLTQPGVLDDTKSGERRLGILAGHAWTPFAQAVVVYTDCGFSRGMHQGCLAAFDAGIPVEYRQLPGWKP
jgi:hypothetical protein